MFRFLDNLLKIVSLAMSNINAAFNMGMIGKNGFPLMTSLYDVTGSCLIQIWKALRKTFKTRYYSICINENQTLTFRKVKFDLGRLSRSLTFSRSLTYQKLRLEKYYPTVSTRSF